MSLGVTLGSGAWVGKVKMNSFLSGGWKEHGKGVDGPSISELLGAACRTRTRSCQSKRDGGERGQGRKHLVFILMDVCLALGHNSLISSAKPTY